MMGTTTQVPRAQIRLPVVWGAGLTNRGKVRAKNEDSILTDPSGMLWAVADGMGGYGHGDVASDIVIDCLATIAEDADPSTSLVTHLTAANTAVLERQKSPGMGQMGSTAVAVIISHAIAHVAWVGDSRAYLMRGGRMRPLTRDHSVVQDMVDRGELAPEKAENHPESHIITRAIGGGPDLEVDFISQPLMVADRLLLCSDGLTRCVDEQTIAAILQQAATPQDACLALTREALDNGAPDNVSTICLILREE